MKVGKVDYDHYAVVDIETTVNAKEPWAFSGAAECPDNYPVLTGFRFPNGNGQPDDVTYYNGYPGSLSMAARGDRLLVGHNIKFDLKYLIKGNSGRVDCQNHCIWDTAIAEYMISGQKMRFPSLNDVAAIYGLGQKESGMKELWDMGIKTENIDQRKLQSYLAQDLKLTDDVYRAQLKLLDTAGAHRLKAHIVRCSTASWYYAHAELEGMPINRQMLVDALVTQQTKSTESLEAVYKGLEAAYGIPSSLRSDWDPMSPSCLGKALYGLPITVTHEEPGLRILKNGQPAKRKRKIHEEFKFHTGYNLVPGSPKVGGNHQIQVPGDLLAETVQRHGKGHWANAVLDYRASEKLLSTYFRPTLEFISKASVGTCTLHPQFQLTATNTGRTSCAKPNAQNMPPEMEKLIKAPPGWKLVKADFKQLQIVGLALVTKDPQLIDDLKQGRDIHYETGKTVYRWTDPSNMNKEDRRVVKNTNFGLIFGGSAGGIALQTGVEKSTVQQCIDAFYLRYPKVKEWQESIVTTIEGASSPIPEEFSDQGDQMRESYTRTPLGRLLRFEERTVPAWVARRTGRGVGFSPNEIVCYPIQGFTDGDIVPEFLCRLTPYLGLVTMKPINMVHDSVWVLTTDPEVTKVQMNTALAEVNRELMLDVPLKLDITVEE